MEFHHKLLTEPNVKVSLHSALVIQSSEISNPFQLPLYSPLRVCRLPVLDVVKSQTTFLLSSNPPISGCLISEVQITESLRSTAITAASSLLRILPHLCPTSLLSSLSVYRLDFSLGIRTKNSPVPYKSLCHAPVTYTPTAI